MLLRVHSEDLHEHVAQEVGECLESGLYTDLMIRCRRGQTVHAHRLVLSAASPFLKVLMEGNDYDDIQTLELPDAHHETVSLLLEVVYNGMVEATIRQLRNIILLAHSLYIAIPLSEELLETLELKLPPIPPFRSKNAAHSNPRPVNQPLSQKQFHGTRPKVEQKLQRSPILKIKLPKQAGENAMIVDPSVLSGQSTPEKVRKPDHVCPVCKLSFTNIGNFKMHMRSHENDHLTQERNLLLSQLISASLDPNTALYICNTCNSTYNHSGNFKQHLLKHERESGTISALLLEQKEKGRSFKLPASNKESHLTSILKSAMTTKKDSTQKGIYNCEHCGRAFNHAGNYKQHLQRHLRMSDGALSSKRQMKELLDQQSAKRSRLSMESELKCQECSQECSSVEELRDHLSAYHDVLMVENSSPKFPCNDCPKEFVSSELLNRHRIVSHGLETAPDEASIIRWLNEDDDLPEVQPRKFKCKDCGKVFPKRKRLVAHSKIHSAPEEHYRFACDICGKKFTRQQHVTRHKVVHSNDRNYSCDLCGAAFSREDDYKEHLETECAMSEPAENFESIEVHDDLADVDNFEDVGGEDENGREEDESATGEVSGLEPGIIISD